MASARYKLKCWGARGTVPTPSADRLAYGGNTACLAVQLGENDYLILDCGSGLRGLGNVLAAEPADRARRFHIFLSHYHFDHIEGLPLFPPLYNANSTFSIYGMDSCGRSVKEILESLVSPPYFPVTLSDTPSNISYRAVGESPIKIGDLTVRSLPLNHPDGCMAFRIECDGRQIVYATDHEHGVEATDKALIEFARGADYLIYDATYQPTEYEELRRGWGHSTWYAAVQTALVAQIGSLVLFHHHPDHTDEDLDAVLRVAQEEFPNTIVAREGLELPL
ncbi:MAG: MBL fold metallo-hydrolase [Acidobacteriota bacterium]|nr:MBL fold metallo-hydrolase [Acidobacteriota bacterium]MDH3785835.1 MBL fold metallo-hydrolase [Acidobacteriota bacterium]